MLESCILLTLHKLDSIRVSALFHALLELYDNIRLFAYFAAALIVHCVAEIFGTRCHAEQFKQCMGRRFLRITAAEVCRYLNCVDQRPVVRGSLQVYSLPRRFVIIF